MKNVGRSGGSSCGPADGIFDLRRFRSVVGRQVPNGLSADESLGDDVDLHPDPIDARLAEREARIDDDVPWLVELTVALRHGPQSGGEAVASVLDPAKILFEELPE